MTERITAPLAAHGVGTVLRSNLASGILASISKCFTDHGVNISQAKCKTTEDRRGINTFQVMVGHVDQLKSVSRAIQSLDGVLSVSRL